MRRGIVTFPYTFPNEAPVKFTLQPTQHVSELVPSLPVDVKVDNETVTISYHNGPNLKVRLLAPPRDSSKPSQMELVESNANFLWHVLDGYR